MATEYVDPATYITYVLNCSGNVAGAARRDSCSGHNRNVNKDTWSFAGYVDVVAGEIVDHGRINYLVDLYQKESTRQERVDTNAALVPLPSASAPFYVSTINGALSNLDDLYTGANLRVGTTNKISASDLNTLYDYLQSAATECVCYCNYGCTCNCNYGCTCNCNYSSDENLKDEFTYL